MAHCERETVSVTTDVSGDGTGVTPTCNGHVAAIVYTKPASGGLTTATITVTGTTSGIVIWSKTAVDASVTVFPMGPPVKSTDGTAYTNVATPVPIADETITVTVASGGNTLTGSFEIIVDGVFY